MACDGRGALGPCTHEAKYLLTYAPKPKSVTPRYACGLHLAQMVKHLLPMWGAVTVGVF